MAVSNYFDAIQKVYIAFYQRPADPAGLYYWAQRADVAGGDMTKIINAFATSEEAGRLYGTIDASTISAVIDQVYQALFNRAPDAAGKQFYVDGFTAGTFTAGTIVLNILDGARNGDAVAIQNKLEAASLFTKALDPEQDGIGPFTATYDASDEAAARTWLADVTSDPLTRKTESTVVADIQATIANPGDAILNQTSGQTFTLTTGIDNFTGTSGNDTFVATIRDDSTSNPSTFDNAGADNLSGGAGYDTLKIYQSYENNDVYVLNASGIEHLMYQTTDEDELYLNGMTDIEKITVFQSDDTGNDFYNVQNLVDVGFENNIGSADANIYVEDTVEAGAVAITLKSNGTNAIDLTYENNSGDDMATSIAITATGTNDDVDLNSTDVTESVTIAGSGTLDLYLDDTDELTSVDASAYTGDLTLGALAAQQDIAVTGGSGDDSLSVIARASTGASDEAIATVSGGAGDDTVTVTSAAGLQTLTAEGGDGDDTITVYASNATVNGSTATINGGAGADDITITGDANVALAVDAGAGDDTVTIDTINATDPVVDAIDGGADTDTLRGTTANIAAIEADDDMMATISNFEQLAITDAMANDVDLTAWGFNRLTLEVGDASAGTVTMASGDTFEIADDSATTGSIVLAVDGASAAGANSDVVNIEVNADFNGADSVDMADVSIAYVETVNLTVADSDADTAGTGTITLTIADGDRIKTINVTSDQTTVVEDDGVTSLTAIDVFNAAGSTGGVTFDGSAGTQGLTGTGGSGDDVITGTDYADILVGGEGDDTLTGGLENDNISGGAGDDTLTGGAGNDTISGGDGDDDITGGTGANTLTGGAGVDNFNFADGDSTSTSMTTITDFTAGTDGDTLTFGAASTYEAISAANQTAIDADTTLAAALTQAASQLAANEVTAFTYGGSTYVLFEDGTNAGAYNAAEDVVIKLTGVTVDDLVAANFL